MARYIHCPKCDTHMRKLAERFNELYESIEGTAVKDMFCDGPCGSIDYGPTGIKVGDACFAAVLLPNKLHPNYQQQKPDRWMQGFINTKTT